jgi:hypothetical protein
VKITGRLVCLFAWILAAVMQIIVVASAPNRAVAFGVDISKANTIVFRYQTLFIAVGLALALASCVFKRWSSLLVIAASALYLVHWFPLRSVLTYGFAAPLKAMYLIGDNAGLRLSFFTRDVALPIAFVVAIVLVVLEVRRLGAAAPSQ